jgi:hypothetical protein
MPLVSKEILIVLMPRRPLRMRKRRRGELGENELAAVGESFSDRNGRRAEGDSTGEEKPEGGKERNGVIFETMESPGWTWRVPVAKGRSKGERSHFFMPFKTVEKIDQSNALFRRCFFQGI